MTLTSAKNEWQFIGLFRSTLPLLRGTAKTPDQVGKFCVLVRVPVPKHQHSGCVYRTFVVSRRDHVFPKKLGLMRNHFPIVVLCMCSLEEVWKWKYNFPISTANWWLVIRENDCATSLDFCAVCVCVTVSAVLSTRNRAGGSLGRKLAYTKAVISLPYWEEFSFSLREQN